MHWIIDPRDAGQTVEVSFYAASNGYIYRRTIDRADMRETVEAAVDLDSDWGGEGPEVPSEVRYHRNWDEVEVVDQ